VVVYFCGGGVGGGGVISIMDGGVGETSIQTTTIALFKIVRSVVILYSTDKRYELITSSIAVLIKVCISNL